MNRKSSRLDLQDALVALVLRERDRQDAKWGKQHHNHGTWSLILGEEVGESCQAALDHAALPSKESLDKLKTELVQVSAVAVAWLEDLEESYAA